MQEGQFERVGDEKTRKVDVRIVAASNRNLKREVEKGRFREDLYYRLHVFPIEVPPLRERKEDIPLLAAFFLENAANEMKRPKLRLTQKNVEELQHHDWPGNVRELQNIMERAVITSRNDRLQFDLAPAPTLDPGILSEDEMRQKERENLLLALNRTRWQVYGEKGAAVLLGVKPSTLTSRIKKLRLTKPGQGCQDG